MFLRSKLGILITGAAVVAVVAVGYGISTISSQKAAKSTTNASFAANGNTNQSHDQSQNQNQSTPCAKGTVKDRTYGQVDIDTCAKPQTTRAKVTQPWAEVDQYANSIDTGGVPLNNMPDTNCQATTADSSRCHPSNGETVQVVCAKTINGQLAWYGILLGQKTILRMPHDADTNQPAPYGYVDDYTNKGDKPVGYVKATSVSLQGQSHDCKQVLHGKEARMMVYMQAGVNQEPQVTLDPNN